MQGLPRLQDADIANQRVVVRVDFNVPLDDKGSITDSTRIQTCLPTIRYILDQGASLVLISHLGRPKGREEPSLSLRPVAGHLEYLLGRPVRFLPDCAESSGMEGAQIILCENLRFHRGEEHPEEEPGFAKKLAELGDFYVNEAFAVSHRKHVSVYELPKLFGPKVAAGLLLQKEVEILSGLLANPKPPFVALIGGKKISTKMGVLEALVDRIGSLLIGGAMAFTFFRAKGISIGNSYCEEEMIPVAKRIIAKCEKERVALHLPKDLVIVDSLDEPQSTPVILPVERGLDEGAIGVDIGPATIKEYQQVLQRANTVLWNGPMGVFEDPRFARGTEKIAEAISELEANTVVGGGDSVAALQQLGRTGGISHLSTGGGASLEFIEKGSLPGIKVLMDRNRAGASVD